MSEIQYLCLYEEGLGREGKRVWEVRVFSDKNGAVVQGGVRVEDAQGVNTSLNGQSGPREGDQDSRPRGECFSPLMCKMTRKGLKGTGGVYWQMFSVQAAFPLWPPCRASQRLSCETKNSCPERTRVGSGTKATDGRSLTVHSVHTLTSSIVIIQSYLLCSSNVLRGLKGWVEVSVRATVAPCEQSRRGLSDGRPPLETTDGVTPVPVLVAP
jgi:hypothetical protein